ncbi:MAG TPA: GWxTD domain-containing protein [Vicinamibacteria bacterium]
MSARVRRLLPLVALLHVALASPAQADSPAVDTKRFPKLVHLLLLPEEEALLKELKDDKDRRELQKIFWARRDPTPGTPANEFEANVRAVWKHADDLFSYPNQKGSETGCGQVLALLGRPEETLGRGDDPRHPSTTVTGRDAREAPPVPGPGRPFDNMAYIREGSTREPETWVYRDRPGLPYTFTGAELKIAFDAECRFAEGGTVAEDLRRAAAALVTRPELALARGADGRLVPLAAAAAPAAGEGARALLSAPRTDFPLAAETKLLMRAPKGEAYVAGLVRAAAGAAAGGPVRVSLAAQAADTSGQAVASSARDVAAPAQADGSVVASWGLTLKPGRYKVTVAALLAEVSRGSAATMEVLVPDLGGGALAASPLVVYPDEPQAAGAADPRDPYASMRLGPMVLRPRYGNAFTAQDALMVVATLYGAKVDPGTGQAALRSRFTILKEGRPVARGAEDAFTTPDAVASVGPIPLADYAPGSYLVRLDVTDKVANQTLRQEVPFEIR